jgi:phage-related protein (TIGR01555 family)
LDAWPKLSEALTWARLYGGSLVILGADDGQPPTAPLNLQGLRSFEWLTVLDRHEADIVQWVDDPRSKDFGAPALYRIQRADAPGVSTQDELVHASRVLRFDGVLTSRRRKLRNNGWSDGVVTRVHNVVRDFSMAWGGTAHLLQDFSQAVFTVRGLANMLAAHEDEAILKRFKIMDMARSIARAVVIDESETFDRKATPVTGLADLLAAFEHRLAAAARMPVSLLMGEAPAGLKATGDSDIRWFYDQIRAEQERGLRPHVNRILECLFHAKQGPTRGREPSNWSFEFNPLWQLDDLQQAELRHKQAQTDALYIQSGVLDPTEVAASRFSGDEYSTETVLDEALRALDAATESDHENADDGSCTPETGSMSQLAEAR